MIQYPSCPFCGNSSSALSVVDVAIDGFKLKGIRCNNPQCYHIFGFFQDCETKLNEIQESISDLESKVDDLESSIDSLYIKL